MADNATRLKIQASVEGIQGFDSLKRSLQGLAQQGQQSGRSLDRLYTATQQLAGAGKNSVSSLRLQVQALTQLRDAAEIGSRRYRILGQDIERVNQQLRQASATQPGGGGGGIMASLATGAGARGALSMQAGEAAMAGRLALAGGITAGLAAGAGAAAVVGGSVSTAMDLAAEQRKVSTLTDDTGKLNQAIAELMRSQNYMTSQAESTSAAYEILSSGFSKTSDVIQILKASTLGAVGGFSDIRTVADATTSILNGYGRSAADAQRVIDMMIQTQNDGKIVVGEYAQSIGRLVPTAAAANISLEEVNAGISALTAQGAPVETTFSGLNQAIKSIIKPTDEARRMAAALGLDFSASALAAKGLGGFLADVTAKTKGNSAALSILFSDIDGYKAVVALTNDKLERFNQFSKNQERAINASAKAAEKAVDPFKQFSNANKDLGNSLGQVLLPPLTSVTKKVTELVRVIMGQGVPERMKELLSLTSGFAVETAPSLLGSFGPAGAIVKGVGALADELLPPPPPPPDNRKDLPKPGKLGNILPPRKTEDRRITELAGQVLEGGAGKPSTESLILKKPYGAQIIAAARKRGLDPALFAGLVQAESGFNQSAISSAGAIGLGQLMPGTARELGVNPRDALQNLAGAAEYLAKQIAEFGLEGGLRAYNQGPGNQQRFPGGVSAEARLYPGKVLAAAKGFGYEDAGGIKAAELQVSALDQLQRKRENLAEQQLRDQQEYGEKQQEEADQNQSIYNQLQARLQISKAITEEEKIRAEYGAKISDLETRLTEEIGNMLDPVQIRIREELRRNEIYQTRIDMLQEIADLQAQQQSEQISAQWQDQQVTLAATLSDYYSQQSEKLQEQNEIAGSLAQTIGQGMQQAFSLAIQGAENLGQSLQELGATVLKDIAQQLIQIAVIAPVIKAISGIGGGGIAPISPGINALPGGDFSSFFTGAGGGSFAAGLPSAAITPFQGGNPFSFATGGIMTPQGPVPLRSYARGGIATAPQAAIYGEGSSPEAFIPLPDGRRVPVALKQYPGIPGGGPGSGQFESTDQVVQRLVETARQESATRAAAVAASSPDGTVRIKVETTRINSVDYVTAAQAEALAQAAATRSTARQQRALQSSPGARRSLGI